MRVAWFSAGVSSLIACYLRIVDGGAGERMRGEEG